MPRIRKHEARSTLALNEEELKTLGTIIGKSIAEELIKHNIFFPSGQNTNEYSKVNFNKIVLDESVIDVGSSTEGIEKKYKKLAKTELTKDEKLTSSRSKLAKVKKGEKKK